LAKVMDAIETVMTKKVITCKPNQSLMEVQKLLVKHRISRVVIVDEKTNPVGIITRKDLVNFVFIDKSSRGLEDIQAEEVMTRDLATAKPTTPISNAAKNMVKKKISSLIITDEEGRLKGIATKFDVCKYLATKGIGIFSVHDFMRSNPITVKPSHPIFFAVSLMSKHKVAHMVVTEKEKPVGIISLTDVTMTSSLLRPAEALKSEKHVIMRGFITLPKNIHLFTARDIMVASPVTVDKDADLSEAARLMIKHGFNCLPVVDKSKKLVGIITSSDLTRAIASIKK